MQDQFEKSMHAALRHANADIDTTGVLIVDHGSRREESNMLLHEVVAMFQELTPFHLVAAAHMELAEPSIEQAFDKLVQQGAIFVVAFPYFLSPGRHWKHDIPALVAKAAQSHPEVRYLVTSPLGKHHLMAQIMMDRIATCVSEPTDGCDVCREDDRCQIRSPGP